MLLRRALPTLLLHARCPGEPPVPRMQSGPLRQGQGGLQKLRSAGAAQPTLCYVNVSLGAFSGRAC
eukprot:6186319-Pleurochrysis_carterae.AAC.1